MLAVSSGATLLAGWTQVFHVPAAESVNEPIQYDTAANIVHKVDDPHS